VAAVSAVPLVAIPKTVGALAFADLGRRAANAPAAVSPTLRYNNQAELDQLVANINQPDISLPFQPMAVYTGENHGSFLATRGTSWSSPAAVALFIEASQLHGSRVGWVNPALYGLFASTGYTKYFTPCTSGTNGAYSCSATQYNQAAGIGAPKGWALANAL
jgi:hypothetical protein